TKGSVVVELLADPAWVTVTVSDEGKGIVVEPPEQIFEPFVSQRPPGECAGLGLWAARQIAEEHGGTLALEQRSPGTAFVLRLPRAKAPNRGLPRSAAATC